MSHPFTDIVIPVHSAIDFVKYTVNGVYEKTSDFRLIIVDDYSDEPTREWLYGPECLGRDGRNLYIRTNKQKWWTRAINIGMKQVRSEFALLLNSDCQMGDGWLEELYRVFNEATAQGLKVGLVGSTMTNDTDPRQWEPTAHPNYVTGHAWLVSMAAMHDLANQRNTPGVFLNEQDQSQIHIASDRIGCYDLNRIGYATIAAFHSYVGHHGGRSWNHDLGRVFNLSLAEVE